MGEPDAALAQLFAGLNPERILGAAMAVGMGRFALDAAVKYANERAVWKEPIGAHQGIAHPLAQRKIEVELAKLMMQKAPRSTTVATISAQPKPRTWPNTLRVRLP